MKINHIEIESINQWQYLECLRQWLLFPTMTLVCQGTAPHRPFSLLSCGQRWCLWSSLSSPALNTAGRAFYQYQWDFQELHWLSERVQVRVILINRQWIEHCDLKIFIALDYSTTAFILYINQSVSKTKMSFYFQ